MARRVLTAIILMILSAVALSSEYRWCPDGGKPTDRISCIRLVEHGRDQYGRTNYEIHNVCEVPVYLHHCSHDEEIFRTKELLCSDPPKPTMWRQVDPSKPGTRYLEYIAGSFTWWAVSCD